MSHGKRIDNLSTFMGSCGMQLSKRPNSGWDGHGVAFNNCKTSRGISSAELKKKLAGESLPEPWTTMWWSCEKQQTNTGKIVLQPQEDILCSENLTLLCYLCSTLLEVSRQVPEGIFMPEDLPLNVKINS